MSVIKKSVTAFMPEYATEHVSGQAAEMPRNRAAVYKTSVHAASVHYRRFSRMDNLSLWHNVTVQTVKLQERDLTTRQLAVLMSVYIGPGPHTVRALADELEVTKAVISRAVDRLCKYEFLRRAPDPDDGRSIVLKRTPAGIHYLQKFADIIRVEMPKGARLMAGTT